ncbi:hypothetical protein V8C37DRAFT_398062 [Trichoderma ceciliae]
MTQQPSAPSSEERELYYFGLPSCPKLVARSSRHVWRNPQMPGPTTFTGTYNMYPKSLRPAGRDSMLNQLWNNAASSLRAQILEAVKTAPDWTAIDIMRVGLKEEFQTTLLLSVMPDSLSWDRGYTIALRCKGILEAHEIYDVDCEIRESVVTFCAEDSSTTDSTAAATASTTGDFQLSSMPIEGSDHERIRVDLTDCLGTKISMKHMDGVAGSKGLYLALSSPSSIESEPSIVALTCRHVVIHSKTEGLESYRHQQSKPPREVIQVDQPTYESSLVLLQTQMREHRKDGDALSEEGYKNSAAIFYQLANEDMALIQIMKPYENSSSRVFGQLLYSPELACISTENGANWLRDWALIELLPNHHQAQMSSLKNKAFVVSIQHFSSLLHKNRRGWKGLPPPRPLVVDRHVELQRVVVPMEEIYNPTHIAEYTDEPALLVAKYGARGGLTFGLGNTLKSVVRHTESPFGDREYISEEWAIVDCGGATDRMAAFSTPGDSGSCIWDMEQRPAGILMAGNGINGLNDVTYAQPLERLLADIRAQGFEVSVV